MDDEQVMKAEYDFDKNTLGISAFSSKKTYAASTVHTNALLVYGDGCCWAITILTTRAPTMDDAWDTLLNPYEHSMEAGRKEGREQGLESGFKEGYKLGTLKKSLLNVGPIVV